MSLFIKSAFIIVLLVAGGIFFVMQGNSAPRQSEENTQQRDFPETAAFRSSGLALTPVYLQ